MQLFSRWLFLVCFGAAILEGANWSTPKQLGQLDSSFPVVAVDDKGDAVAVWTHAEGESFSIQASRKLVKGDWSKPVVLSGKAKQVGMPFVVMDSKGNAVAVWQEKQGKKFALQCAALPIQGKKWTKLESPFTTPFLVPQLSALAVDSQGNITLFSLDDMDDEDDEDFSSFKLHVARLPNDYKKWTRVEDVQFEIKDDFNFSPATDPNGNAIIAWSTEKAIKSIALTNNAFAWSEERVVKEIAGSIGNVEAFMDRQGTAIVAWETNNEVQAAKLPLGSSNWEPIDFTHYALGWGQLAFDQKGNGVAVWLRDEDNRILSSSMNAGENIWSQPVVLLDENGDLPEPTVSMDKKGNAVAAWINNNTRQLQVVTKPVGGQWSEPQVVASLDTSISDFDGLYFMQLAENGTVVIVYNQTDFAEPNTVFAVIGKNLF